MDGINRCDEKLSAKKRNLCSNCTVFQADAGRFLREIVALKRELREVKAAIREQADANDDDVDVAQQLALEQLQAGACVTSLCEQTHFRQFCDKQHMLLRYLKICIAIEVLLARLYAFSDIQTYKKNLTNYELKF